MNITDRERLYIAQALYKAMGEVVSTKSDSLRTTQDKELLEAYKTDGVKSLDAKVNGKKVGTYSVTVSKAETKTGLETVDRNAFFKWAQDNGFVKNVIDYDNISENFKLSGEVPDGCKVVKTATPERAKGTVLKIEPKKVADALGAQLPETIAGFLEGSE